VASRKEEKARLRQEREERERTAAAGARRKRLIGYGVAGALGLAVLIAIVAVSIAGGGGGDGGGGNGSGDGPVEPDPAGFPTSPVPAQRTTVISQAARAAGCTTRSFRSEGRDHTPDPVQYKSNPAHSGSHDPVPAEDGAYTEAPRTENLVHSLEHGRVIVQFRPSASEELKGQLKSLYDEDPYHVILTPNPDMPYEVAATAWTEVLACEQANPQVFDAIRAFKERHRDRGPEFVP
jgi:hypothetical protein